jgi:hypothetical protein
LNYRRSLDKRRVDSVYSKYIFQFNPISPIFPRYQMAASCDIPMIPVPELPTYSTGSLIRYYPVETNDEHYTVLQLKSGEVLQLKSTNPMVRKQLKFPTFASWYETLTGSPDPATFKVLVGKGSPFDSPSLSHLESFPDADKTIGDIYLWNRNIIPIMMELTPHLLHNPTFVKKYNTFTSLLTKYAANLMLTYTKIEKYNPSHLLLLIPGEYGGWFKNLALTWIDDYLGMSAGRRLEPAPPILSTAEKFTAKSQIIASLKACIDVISPTLYNILYVKYKNIKAKSLLDVYIRRLKSNEHAIKKLENNRKWLEECTNQCARRIRETEKTLEEATATFKV